MMTDGSITRMDECVNYSCPLFGGVLFLFETVNSHNVVLTYDMTNCNQLSTGTDCLDNFCYVYIRK